MPLPKTLIKSDCDDREYRFVDLPNKMKCLLISDMQADMSAAAINVHIGSASDPRPLYGVAHFLEHMLFQGTEKYPIENEYSEFMKNNGGYDNAFTSLTDTNYHFEVSNEGFEEGLDRLSQFFISPNFSENSAAREVNAVDSEWEMSKQSDGWHFYNLTCALSEKESNYNRFACGNKASLANPTIRESLLEFHKKWYSANIMTLCVCGKESLDWLEKQVVEKFSPVVNKDVVVPELGVPQPYPKSKLGKLIKYVPVKDKDILSVFYSLPYCELDHKTQPLKYFSALIGHEGKNSLLSYLKAEDLAVELCTDLDHNMSSLTFLEIEITLTKHGLQNYERVAEAAFQYIKNVEASGPQEYFFKENQDIGIMNFKFADKGGAIDTVTSLAGAMPKFTDDNVQDMIRVKHEIDEFDQEKCRMYAKLLCDPSNMNLILKSKDFEGKTTDVLDWYDTKYSTEDIPEDLMKKLQNPNSQIKDKKLGLPPVNKLIAKNFDILPNVPILLKSWPGSADLWYKKDEKFNRPKSIIHMKLYTNDCLFSIKPEARVFASVWKSVLEEYLREFKYMAEESRLALEITLDYDSLDFQWEGFNDSMPNFIVETMTMVKQMPSEDLKQIFAQVKEQLLLEWKNFYLEPSYRLVTKSIQSIVVNVAMEKKQLRHHLESFNFDQFQEYLADWLKAGRYVWYVCGNFGQEKAIELVESVKNEMALADVKIEELADVRAVSLPAGTCLLIEQPLESKDNDNSCCFSYYEVGQIDLKTKLVNQVVMQYLDEPFFDDLRTKQQLGYVVFNRADKNRGVTFNKFVVQSPGKSAEYLVNAINVFMLRLREEVKEATQEDFDTQKKSVHTQLAEKAVNLTKDFENMWPALEEHHYEFTRQEDSLKVLETVTLADFKAHFEKVFFSSEAKRLDFTVTSEKHKEDQEKDRQAYAEGEMFKIFKRETVTESIVAFKKQSGLFPDVYKTNFYNQVSQRK